MSTAIDVSLFNLLRQSFGATLEPLRCSKATLVHLSHTLEDLVLAAQIPALLFTGFQESSHWRTETERYRALAMIAQQICIFAGGELPPESSAKELHVTLRGDDPLRQEWFVVLLSSEFSVLLCGQDCAIPTDEEATRQFDTLWSFEPAVLTQVITLLEEVVATYRPERLAQLQAARTAFPPIGPNPQVITRFTREMLRFEEQLQQRLARTVAALEQQMRWHDDLTATLVHDMRSPLQSMVLSIDMLAMNEQFDKETFAHMLGITRRSAQGLSDLVQIMLDTHQLTAGQLALTWQPIQPTALVTSALEPLQILSEQHNTQLTVQINEEVKLIWGDKALLTRVLQNLVGNAIKFTPPGGQISVEIALAPNGKMIEIRVRDNGAGISPSALPTIFERYMQAQSSDRRGNGLGLFFCRLVCEAHSGTIRAASELGSGATITVVLPSGPPK